MKVELLYSALERPLSKEEEEAIAEQYLELTLASLSEDEKRRVFGIEDNYG